MKKIHLTVIFTVFYILGILASEFDKFIPVASFSVFILGFFGFCYKLLPKQIIAAYLFLILGFANAGFQIKQEDNLIMFTNRPVEIEGTISSIPQTSIYDKTSFFADVDVLHDDKNRKFENLKSKIYLTVNTDSGKIQGFEIGDRIRVSGKIKMPYKIGNPNQFDFGKFLKYKHVFTTMYVKNEKCIITGQADSLKMIFLKKLSKLRQKIIKKQSKYIKSPNLEILGGVIFGDDAVTPPQDIKESFVTSGILHILAASGMNVAFIFSVLTCILGLLRIPLRTTSVAGAVAVLIYAAMTGFPPSIIRAVIMLEFVILGRLINKDADSVSLLSFAALIMLIFEPAMLFNISFQLSFLVTLGIILFAPLLHKFLSENFKFGNRLIFLFIPIIAQVFVIPLQMYYFQTFSTYSVFANILIIPFLTVVSFVGFISSIVATLPFVSDFLLRIFSYLLNPSLSAIIWISKVFSSMDNAMLETYKMHFVQIIFYYAILLFLYFTIKNYSKKIGNYICIILCSAILCLSFIKIPNNNFEVVFFDVQNADCILIKSPQNQYFVIDSGRLGYKTNYSQAKNILIPYLKENRVKEINTFIITHFDSDHAGGAIELLSNFRVNNVIMPENVGNARLGNIIKNYVTENNIKYTLAENQQTFYEEPELILTNYIVKTKDENESSIITLAQNNGYNLLFTADTPQVIVDKLNLPKEIYTLKVGHHGGKGSLSKEFIQNHNIKNAIISSGQNNYNHPHRETIEILKATATNIFRTDIDNAVKIVNNKNTSEIFLYNQQKDTWKKVLF